MTEAVISVIIPTLNEEAALSRVIESLQSDASAAYEIVIADGGSSDATLKIADNLDLRVVTSPQGRGQQLSAGARAATGDVLWFLHADSHVQPGSLAAIRQQVNGTTCIGGNFRLEFDGNDAFSAWLTGFYAWIRRRGLYYGDSGMFIDRKVYNTLGGFRPISLMEDYDLSRRMERTRRTCCVATPALVTSSRKFRGRRPVSIFVGWLWLHTLFALGANPARLARIYYGNQRSAPTA